MEGEDGYIAEGTVKPMQAKDNVLNIKQIQVVEPIP